MRDGRRLLIVGTDPEPQICMKLLRERFETKSRDIATLEAADVRWSDLILITQTTHRRTIADRFPEDYLVRRVMSLEVPDWVEPDERILEPLIREQLVNHGLLQREHH